MLAYDRNLLYEAKILKRRVTDIVEYFIHFKGFNSKWNKWVYHDEVLEINDINLNHKDTLVDRL